MSSRKIFGHIQPYPMGNPEKGVGGVQDKAAMSSSSPPIGAEVKKA
jgi:hypothetical protein